MDASGAVTLIQRFGSAANPNIPLHCLVLDGVYRRTGGEPVFRACAGDRPRFLAFRKRGLPPPFLELLEGEQTSSDEARQM